jgi:hypothetical protein
MKKNPKVCATCGRVTQAALGRARIAKLTAKERSELARLGGLAKAAAQEARCQKLLNNWPSETVNSAIKRIKATGRKVTSPAILREIQPESDKRMELMASFPEIGRDRPQPKAIAAR